MLCSNYTPVGSISGGAGAFFSISDDSGGLDDDTYTVSLHLLITCLWCEGVITITMIQAIQRIQEARKNI